MRFVVEEGRKTWELRAHVGGASGRVRQGRRRGASESAPRGGGFESERETESSAGWRPLEWEDASEQRGSRGGSRGCHGSYPAGAQSSSLAAATQARFGLLVPRRRAGCPLTVRCVRAARVLVYMWLFACMKFIADTRRLSVLPVRLTYPPPPPPPTPPPPPRSPPTSLSTFRQC